MVDQQAGRAFALTIGFGIIASLFLYHVAMENTERRQFNEAVAQCRRQIEAGSSGIPAPIQLALAPNTENSLSTALGALSLGESAAPNIQEQPQQTQLHNQLQPQQPSHLQPLQQPQPQPQQPSHLQQLQHLQPQPQPQLQLQSLAPQPLQSQQPQTQDRHQQGSIEIYPAHLERPTSHFKELVAGDVFRNKAIVTKLGKSFNPRSVLSVPVNPVAKASVTVKPDGLNNKPTQHTGVLASDGKALTGVNNDTSGSASTISPQSQNTSAAVPVTSPVAKPTQQKPQVIPRPQQHGTSSRPKATQAPKATTLKPQQVPTQAPSVTNEAPSQVPTEAPKQVPNEAPSQVPTEAPSQVPTEAPSQVPTEAPKQVPNEAPSQVPTEAPKQIPTEAPPQVLAEASKQVPTEASVTQ